MYLMTDVRINVQFDIQLNAQLLFALLAPNPGSIFTNHSHEHSLSFSPGFAN